MAGQALRNQGRLFRVVQYESGFAENSEAIDGPKSLVNRPHGHALAGQAQSVSQRCTEQGSGNPIGAEAGGVARYRVVRPDHFAFGFSGTTGAAAGAGADRALASAGRSAETIASATKAPNQSMYKVMAAMKRVRADFEFTTGLPSVSPGSTGWPIRWTKSVQARPSVGLGGLGFKAVSKSKTSSKSDRESLGVFSRSPAAIRL
jgi:hypothetical protein